MVASLPTELKLMIIEEALARAPSQERQRARHAIRRVSREWRDSIDYWKEIEVVGIRQVENLKAKSKLKRTRASTLDQVRSVYIEVTNKKGTDKGSKVAGLLKLLVNVESVVLVTGASILSSGRVKDSVGSLVRRALATLTEVRHFTLAGLNDSLRETPYLHDETLRKLVQVWPKLESVDLGRAGCRLRTYYHHWMGSRQPVSVLQPTNSLSTLALSIPDSSGTYEDALFGLPATLTHLTIRSRVLYTGLVSSVSAKLAPHAAQLRALTLTDPALPSGQRLAPVARGSYDGLVGALTGVRVLAVGPCAVSSLAAVLVPLGELSELRLVEGSKPSMTPVAHTELHGLISSSASLRKVALSKSIWLGWSGADQAAIEAAAALKSVTLEQI